LGEGHQAKVYVASILGKDSSLRCVKVFEPYKDVDSKYNAETEFKVS
jgi:hypothetical protein